MNENVIDIDTARGSSRMAEVRNTFDRFAWMRGWLRDEEIDSGHTKLVLTVLFDHMGQNGKAWPSIATIARLASCGERTVQRHLRIAEALGWVQITERDGDSSIYAATHPRHCDTPVTDAPPSERRGTPVTDDTPTPVTVTPKQTIRTDQEQTTAAAGGREEENHSRCIWSTDYDMPELVEHERPQADGVAMYWKQKTDQTIKPHTPSGRGKDLRDLCRHFDRETVKRCIDAAGHPRVTHAWPFFIGCLERVAQGEPPPPPPGEKKEKSGGFDWSSFRNSHEYRGEQ